MPLIYLIVVLFLTACQFTKNVDTTQTVTMYHRDGDQLGTATLTEHPDGVQLTLELEGMSPGIYGLHIHEKAKCEPPNFQSAGNHFNPENKAHGLLHPKGPHAGDLPNIEADETGKVNVELMIRDVTLRPDSKMSLTKGEGTALIVTERPDDGMTQISGNSGERIICGEIKAKES